MHDPLVGIRDVADVVGAELARRREFDHAEPGEIALQDTAVPAERLVQLRREFDRIAHLHSSFVAGGGARFPRSPVAS